MNLELILMITINDNLKKLYYYWNVWLHINSFYSIIRLFEFFNNNKKLQWYKNILKKIILMDFFIHMKNKLILNKKPRKIIIIKKDEYRNILIWYHIK